MNRILKYIFKGTVIVVGVLLILYILVFAYVSVNKQKIIRQVTDEIGKKLNGTVKISTVELSFLSTFPRVSVVLHDILITDTLYNRHQHPFFKADDLYAKVNIWGLVKKESFVNGIKILNGSIYLFTDSSGYTNTYLLKPKQSATTVKSSSAGKNELKNITLTNVRITIEDKSKNKLHDIAIKNLKVDLDDKDSSTLTFDANADMQVHSLAFNVNAGSFIKEKEFQGRFAFRYDKALSRLFFDNINVKLSGQPFTITAMFDLAGSSPQFNLQAHTDGILYSFARSLVTEKISKALKIADLDKPLTVDIVISGPLKTGEPLIHALCNTTNSRLVTPFLTFENASFVGAYTNEVVPGLPREDPNSRIEVSKFTATWQGLPVSSSKIDILDLKTPLLNCDLQSSFPLATLNDLLGSNTLQLQSGDCAVNLTYKGPIEKNDNTNSFVNGNLTFRNGLILYSKRNLELKNVEGQVNFKNSDVYVTNLRCIFQDNKIIMNGEAKNLLTLINTTPSQARINWKVYFPTLNLNNFIFLLKPGKKVSANSGKNKLSKMARMIDQVLENGSVELNISSDKLMLKKFTATNVNANLSLLQDRFIINRASMTHAGGNMNLSGSLSMQNSNYHPAKINVTLDHVDVSKVFYAFDNFGQDGITDKSLEGKLSAKIDASLAVDNSGKVNPSSVESVVDFSLKDGALNNYEPVKKLQSFLFKKRDFDNIRFAELKDKLEIKNQEIKINRMEIQSSVLSMFVEGIYSNKGSTDMSIQVPLSNLKKRGLDYIPENGGTGKKVGASVFIRGRPGPDGNIKFKTDLFNKYKKSKEKNL